MVLPRPSWRREGLSRARALSLALVAALAGCRRDGPTPRGAELLAQVKSALAERDQKLRSFHLEGEIREAGRAAPFEAFFRAPNRVRGEVRSGEGRVISFDGVTLYELDRAARTLTTYDVKGDRAGAAVALNQLLGAFVPEGYRVPVIDLGGASAALGPHPRGPQAVTLTSETRDERGERIALSYVLRWPGADLLEKRLTAYGRTKVLTVEEEHCDERLRLCVPRRTIERLDGGADVVTALSRVELNQALPAEAFALAAPEGYATRAGALPPR